ncbi:MAG TPA: hypothetical protein VMU80_12670 [Bryobacteraceae bacterium]|nr:hypothetical protein [Bryobacteraceae bacterium]
MTFLDEFILQVWHGQFPFHWMLGAAGELRGGHCPVLGTAVRFYELNFAAARQEKKDPKKKEEQMSGPIIRSSKSSLSVVDVRRDAL